MKGVRFLFHVAADYRLWARDPDEIARNNVEGTRLVMEEALRAGVERIVYTSSVATLKISGDVPATEAHPLAEDEAIGVYKRSKVAAERLVEAMIANDGLPAVIVNPSTPIGPRDVKPTPTGRIIVEAASGRMPAFVDTGLNLAHVDDVAAGHLAALERGRIGERYILGGENVLLGDMLGDIARLMSRSPPTLKLPRGMLYPVAYAAEFWARIAGGEPFATVDGLRMAKRRMFFDDSKGAPGARLRLPALSRGPRRRDRVVSRKRPADMIVTALALLALAVWVYLLAGRGAFWLCSERDDKAAPPEPTGPSPSVAAIIPARDEADMIAHSVGSLLRQDYRGSFSVVLVDDQSADGTAAAALAAASAAGASERLRIVAGLAPPPGWTGKLWAMQQGLAAVEAGGQTRGLPVVQRR